MGTTGLIRLSSLPPQVPPKVRGDSRNNDRQIWPRHFRISSPEPITQRNVVAHHPRRRIGEVMQSPSGLALHYSYTQWGLAAEVADIFPGGKPAQPKEQRP